jgi:hypothetical protein
MPRLLEKNGTRSSRALERWVLRAAPDTRRAFTVLTHSKEPSEANYV